MQKEEVAAALDEIGTLLELQGENAFRCNAYHNAARTLEQLQGDLAEIIKADKLTEIRGIGDTLRDKITALVLTGKLPFLDDLRAKTPPGLLQMLRVGGLGPKKVKALYDQLGVDDLDKLKAACEAGRIAGLKGFGAKTQQKVLEGVEFLKSMADRVRIDQAEAVAMSLLDALRDAPGVRRIEVCGSLRRRKETVKDIDLLVCADDPKPVMDRFVGLPDVVQVLGRGDTKASVTLKAGSDGYRYVLQADLRVVAEEQFPFALNYFTGSKEHNIEMRRRALARGLKLNEYELVGPDKRVSCRDEADLYRALDLPYIQPELRELTGEVEAAEKGELPVLLETADVSGVFHCHTTYSDGADTLEDMAKAAKALGLKYLGLADHSQSLTVANGLNPDRVRQQQEAIDALNKRLKGIRLFKGTECDILADGRLDYDDDLLATFDYVVASVHTHFGQSREEITDRIVRAVRHPAVTMLGHATGRLLLRREGYPVDLEAVLQAAAECGVMVEINAHPVRLDLDWIHCKRAKALGVPIVINPDAHSTQELSLYRFGVDVARRGWLTKTDVFNTRSVGKIAETLEERRSRLRSKK
jgi:DNA polymerase (family 10)